MAGKSGVSGFTEASAVLKDLSPAIQERVLQQAAFAGAGMIRDEIKAYAPMGARSIKARSSASKEYGRLRANLKVRPMTKLPRGVKGAMVTIGRSFWALFYEFGTAHQKARPFFRPAFDSATWRVSKRVAEGVVAGIEREAARLARKAGVRK